MTSGVVKLGTGSVLVNVPLADHLRPTAVRLPLASAWTRQYSTWPARVGRRRCVGRLVDVHVAARQDVREVLVGRDLEVVVVGAVDRRPLEDRPGGDLVAVVRRGERRRVGLALERLRRCQVGPGRDARPGEAGRGKHRPVVGRVAVVGEPAQARPRRIRRHLRPRVVDHVLELVVGRDDDVVALVAGDRLPREELHARRHGPGHGQVVVRRAQVSGRAGVARVPGRELGERERRVDVVADVRPRSDDQMVRRVLVALGPDADAVGLPDDERRSGRSPASAGSATGRRSRGRFPAESTTSTRCARPTASSPSRRSRRCTARPAPRTRRLPAPGPTRRWAYRSRRPSRRPASRARRLPSRAC